MLLQSLFSDTERWMVMGMDKTNRVTFEEEADLYEKEALAEIQKAHCDPTAEMGKPYSTLQMGRRVIYRAKQELANRVEVVRCKDCKYFVGNDKMLTHCSIYGALVADDDFCSYGERREGE